MITAHTKRRSIRTRRGSLLFVNGTAQIGRSRLRAPLVQWNDPTAVIGDGCGRTRSWSA
jgi:hypothetical protein